MVLLITAILIEHQILRPDLINGQLSNAQDVLYSLVPNILILFLSQTILFTKLIEKSINIEDTK